MRRGGGEERVGKVSEMIEDMQEKGRGGEDESVTVIVVVRVVRGW